MSKKNKEPKIYESPDGGKTVYERGFGMPIEERKLVMPIELEEHLDEFGLVDDPYVLSSEGDYLPSSQIYGDSLTINSSDINSGTVTVNMSDSFTITDPTENNRGKRKLPKSLYKKYGLAD